MTEVKLTDGTTCHIRRDRVLPWHRVEGRLLHLGDRFVLAGIEREVILTMQLPGATGIRFLPNFEDSHCEPCGRRVNPPDADWCKDHCELWGERPHE